MDPRVDGLNDQVVISRDSNGGNRNVQLAIIN